MAEEADAWHDVRHLQATIAFLEKIGSK